MSEIVEVYIVKEEFTLLKLMSTIAYRLENKLNNEYVVAVIDDIVDIDRFIEILGPDYKVKLFGINHENKEIIVYREDKLIQFLTLNLIVYTSKDIHSELKSIIRDIILRRTCEHLDYMNIFNNYIKEYGYYNLHNLVNVISEKIKEKENKTMGT